MVNLVVLCAPSQALPAWSKALHAHGPVLSGLPPSLRDALLCLVHGAHQHGRIRGDGAEVTGRGQGEGGAGSSDSDGRGSSGGCPLSLLPPDVMDIIMSKAADPLWDWPVAPAAALTAQPEGSAGNADADMGVDGDKAGNREVEGLAGSSREAAGGGVGRRQGSTHMFLSSLLGAFASLPRQPVQSAASASAPHATPQEAPSGPVYGGEEGGPAAQPSCAWDGPLRAGGMPCTVLPHQIHRRSLNSRR